MNIAIVHYHCRPGGVTRVIESAVGALREQGARTVVLTGEAPEEAAADLGAIRVIEWLAYGGEQGGGTDRRAQALTEAAAEALGAEPDVWHFHNHSLGKNLSVPLAVSELARSGRRLLLQIHDFPEDGRPGNYAFLLRGLSASDPDSLGRTLYPVGAGVHYAVLNDRDRDYLLGAGAAENRVSLLPNPVVLSGGEEDGPPPENAFLYVTRAIRRKNLGEFLLWAAAAEDGERFRVTRAPLNPAQRPAYDRWVAVARETALPVDFEAGERSGLPLRALMRRARCMMTTSVAEGFGMAFLEPWLAGRAVAGRNLPEVTRGFAAKGVDLSALYDRLGVPLDWVGEAAVRSRLAAAMRASLAAYGREFADGMVDRAMADMARDGLVDFGRLDEPLQETVVRRVAGSAGARSFLVPPRLAGREISAELVADNRRSVEKNFSLKAYGERLAALCRAVAESAGPPGASLSGGRLLDQFLAPERFCLLRA